MAQKEAVLTGEVVKAIDWNKYAIDTKDGRHLMPLQIADEAERLSGEVMGLGDHVFLMASKCGSPDEFMALMGEIEHQKGWGKGGKTKAPSLWPVYKSTINRAWRDQGVIPGKPRTLKLPAPEGGEREETLPVEGINQLKVAASRVKKAATIGKAPAPRAVPEELAHAIEECIALYQGLSDKDKAAMVKRFQKMNADYAAKQAA